MLICFDKNLSKIQMSYSEYMRTVASRRQIIVDPCIKGDASTHVMRKRLAISRVFAFAGGQQAKGSIRGYPDRSYPGELNYDHCKTISGCTSVNAKQLGRPPPASDFVAYQASRSMGEYVPVYGHDEKIYLECGGCTVPYNTTLQPSGLYRASDAPVSAAAVTAQVATRCNQVFGGPPKLVNLLTNPRTRNVYDTSACCQERMVHNKGAASQNYYRHPDSLGTPNYVPPTNTGTGIASNPNAYKVGGYYNPRSRYQENHHPSGDARVRTFRVPIPYDPVSGASGKPHLRLNQPVFDRNEA
jgi:hypothetical protein